MEAAAAQRAAVNPALNAVIHPNIDGALQAADGRISDGRFTGIPFLGPDRATPRACRHRPRVGDRRRRPRPLVAGGSRSGSRGLGGNVLTLAYLATNRTGRTYVVIVLTQNPSALIDETTAPPIFISAN